MTKYEEIKFAYEEISKHWGEEVVIACFEATPFNDTFSHFLDHCTACGGNWGGMLLSGIRELYPEVYDDIPDRMGVYAWQLLLHTLILLGVKL